MKKKILILVSLFIFSIQNLFSAEIIETTSTVEDMNIQILKILSRVTEDKFHSPDKTGGFIHRYTDNFFSPFNFNIYIGKINKNSLDAIIRIESPRKGEAKVLRRIIESEILKNPDRSGKGVTTKSHILSQLFNVVTPAASVYYNSRNSPFYYDNDASKKILLYVLADILLVGGAYYYADKTNTKKKTLDDLFLKKGPSYGFFEMKNSGIIMAALASTRIIRMFGAASETAAQNRMAELSYTFKF
ncbi:MAG: hypothetical protein L6Q54_02200 [Leptospiraceae bacterium]|nr:hypothetical protein [Leptospiraceae bacterium]MCK6380050.1 hypothetical protein [Leptospiraceae bacterium]NUM40643.1 hypothetical protein [Leptospiraceae bacterium]